MLLCGWRSVLYNVRLHYTQHTLTQVLPNDDFSSLSLTTTLPLHNHHTKQTLHVLLPTIAPSSGDIYKTYFNVPTLSDLTILLSDQKVYVHRIILCRCSKYFNKLVLNGFKVSSSIASLIGDPNSHHVCRNPASRKSHCMAMILW